MRKFIGSLAVFLSDIKRLIQIVNYKEIYKFVLLKNKLAADQLIISLEIKQIEYQPVFLRLGTTDYKTLISTFFEQYHLPPQNLPYNPTILDLGSNIGFTILHFAYLYKKAQIIGVEMDINNFQLAQKNLAGLTNCILINKAISSSKGVVSYSINNAVDGYHIAVESEIPVSKIIKVESTTIVDIIYQYKLKNIHYLKMDIEGEEVNVFDENVCNLDWLEIVKMLNIEVHTTQSDLEKIMTTLRKHGFTAWKDSHHWSSVMAVR